MAPRTPPAVLLALLAAALAGCTGSPPPEPAADDPEAQGPAEGLVPTDEAANATQPTEPEAQQGEFARSLDEKFHTHNYWGEALEKLLMDEDVTSAPLTPDPANGLPGLTEYAFLTLIAQGPGLTYFTLPEGSIVPPEAERVEVAITWATSPTITGLRLAYSTAEGEADDIEALEPLPEGGGTYTIATNLSRNDMPHTTTTKWNFYLVPENTAAEFGPAVFNGTVHVTIKAFRPDVLYVAPPHPDFWGDNTTLELANATMLLKGQRVLVPVFTSRDEGGFAFIPLPNGTIVPPHTGVITITLEWTNSVLADPFGTRPELWYSSANTFGIVQPENAQVEDGRATYTIAVDNRMVDSPYATESSWFFLVAMDSDAPTDQGVFFGDVGLFEGEFTLRAIAEREQLAI